MKFNFRKISAIASSVLLTGMTIGVAAAAAFPAPFKAAGASGTAIVYGSGADASDSVAANSVATYLASQMGSAAVTGESFLYEKSQDKLTIGKGILDVVSSSLDDGELPNLLADGKYRDNDNDEFDFTQKITISNQTLELFEDNDYKEDTPVLGIKIGGNTQVLNYTLDFTTNPLWDDLSNSDFNILGREYYVSQTNTTSGSNSLTLLDSAAKLTLNAGETKTVVVNGVTYEVTPAVFDTTNNKVSLIVNGGSQTKLLSSGNVESLGNNVYIGVETVVANAYAGGTQYVEVSIGSGKLELIDGQQIEINDDTVDGMTSEITLSGNKLDRINIVWKTGSDELFVTEDSEAVMPAFGAVKLVYTGLQMPEGVQAEELKVVDGSSDYLKLDDFPLEKGAVDLPLLYYNDSNFTIVGKDSDERVLTSKASTVTFNGSSHHDYMVATWNTTNAAESYILKATSFSNENSYATNKTTFQYLVDGTWKELETVEYTGGADTDEVTMGSLVLTTGAINYADKTVAITAGSNVNFRYLFSKEGMRVTMPTTNTTATTIKTNQTYGVSCNAAIANAIANGDTIYDGMLSYNNSATGGEGPLTVARCYGGPGTYSLIFTEEDRSGNLASGATITLTLGGEGTSNEVSAYDATISGDRGGESNRHQTGDNTKIYISYAESDLGTKVLEDENDADRETVTLTYNGGETFGKFYVAEMGSSSTSTNAGAMVFLDTQTGWNDKDVVLVGGNCVNTATAQVLGLTSANCLSTFEAKTGAGSGKYFIGSYADKFTAGKIALVVAGYSAADTTAAANYLTTNPSKVDTTAGKTGVGVVGTTGTISFAQA